MVELAAVIVVCTVLGMQRVLDLAYDGMQDHQNTLLALQNTERELQTTVSDLKETVLNLKKTVLELRTAPSDQKSAPLGISLAGAGFEKETHGMYFLIKEKGTTQYLHAWGTEGSQLKLSSRNNGKDWNESMVLNSHFVNIPRN